MGNKELIEYNCTMEKLILSLEYLNFKTLKLDFNEDILLTDYE
jgi:hypothetical protein